jgi:hypothetical protein
MLTDDVIDKKMIGLWQMFNLPSLKASITGDKVRFSFISMGQEKDIIRMPAIMFIQLEPIEIRDVIERALYKYYGVDGTMYRSDLRGFSRNPFSSQN